ncbi:DUF2797 domain-containing protein, partial [Streptacidiphilus jeojiense]
MNGAPVWRPTGVIWTGDRAQLEWSTFSGDTPRCSPIRIGADLALTCGSDRRCTGLWRSGRRLHCPTGTPIAAAARTAQCPSCQALDRSSSIAADTRLEDPRPVAVYLAHHGSVIKVGITAVERGTTRLLEQGALASTVISTGTLPGARRAENLVTTVLGLPDRASAQRKRAARIHPGTPGRRAEELLAAAGRSAQLSWPQGQDRQQATVIDHTGTYHLPPGGLAPVAALRPLTPARTIAGRVACLIGGDLYLETAQGLVLLDTRLLTGWALD